MTPEEVRTELGKLPEPHRTRCLKAYASFPRENASGVRPNKYKVAVAIDSIHWHSYGDWDYLRGLYTRADAGEFDTPLEEEVVTISVDEYAEYKALKALKIKLAKMVLDIDAMLK